MMTLKQTLLKLGGSRVGFTGPVRLPSDRPPQVWYGADRVEPGAPGHARLNTAVRYAQCRDIDVGVGYAVGEDGIWVEHAWGFQGEYLLELTLPQRIYWGCRLTAGDRRNFCYDVGVICK